jgi:hypothetical protein
MMGMHFRDRWLLLGIVLTASLANVVRSNEASKSSALENLQFAYQVAVAEAEKPMEDLYASYRKQLGKLEEGYQNGANLEGVVAVKRETESFAAGQFRNVERFSELSKARAIFVGQRRKIHADSLARTTKLYDGYRKKLEKLKDDLTRTGKLDDALLVVAELKSATPPSGPPEEWWVVEVSDSYYTRTNGTWTSKTVKESGRKTYGIESDQHRGKLDLTFSDRRLKSDLREIKEAVFQFRVDGGPNSESDAYIKVTEDGKKLGSVKGARKNELVRIPLDPAGISRQNEAITLQIRCGNNAVIILTERSSDPPLLLLKPKGRGEL